MKRLLAIGLIASASCSGTDPIVPSQPTADQVRDFYALNPESCVLYSTGASQSRANIPAPNTTAIAGKTLYVRSIRPDAGGLADEWFFEVGTEGDLKLLRSVEGLRAADRVTRNFPAETAPVFLVLELDLQMQLRFQGTRFESEVAPEVCAGSDCTPTVAPLERHIWTVSSSKAVTLPKGLGVQEGYDLNYRIERDGNTENSFYTLVPGFGLVNFTDATGATFQACDLRACDAAGNCQGATTCGDLSCN